MHIVLNLRRAGAQEVVRTLSEYLATTDNCVPVVCTFVDGPIRCDLETLGIKVELLGGHRRHKIVALPWFIAELLEMRRKLAQLVREYEIDIVQTHLLEMLDFMVLTLRFGTNLRVIFWTIHNVHFLPLGDHWLPRLKRFVYRWIYRLAANEVSGFIAVSDEVRESMIRQVGPVQHKIITIPNGVDVRRFECSVDGSSLRQQLAIEPDARLITTVGRLTTQKGFGYLITAAAEVVPCCPNVHFLIIGDGELKGKLQAQTQSLDVSDHIHFLGIRDDVPAVLAASELFVLPSLWEGLSIALLEAMASGKPIVATAVSGTTQVMVPGETGLIVPPGDSRALADAIQQLLADPMHADALGQTAKRHVATHFSAKKQADEHLAIYHRFLANST
jgi:glycosyltransferase involved in cell wall biosynthesis